MRILAIHISNFRSFGPVTASIKLLTPHIALVGKNNVGKSNVFEALELVLGSRNPSYLRLQPDDYHDTSKPVAIGIEIGDILEADKGALFSLPNIAKKHVGALIGQLKKEQNPTITLTLTISPEEVEVAEAEGEEGIAEQEGQGKKFEIKLWGFSVHRKVEDIRKALVRLVKVPAVRDVGEELKGSRWTSYGQLMKEVLEDSPLYPEVKELLERLNSKIQEVFSKEKAHLLKGARVVAYVEDIAFQLTRENNPSELLRNLEVFIKEGPRLVNVDKVGTGTQSAIIIGILELVLKGKHSRTKIFCIEEPEAFIHPHGIRYLGNLLREIAQPESKTQVILSTHSPSLISTFEPKEIVRLVKTAGVSVIHQPKGLLLGDQYKRFVNADNAEMFFSDHLFLVEGPTEKHLFPILARKTFIDPSDPLLGPCDLDKANIGLIQLSGSSAILPFLAISKEFSIRATGLLDKDFLQSKECIALCKDLGIDITKKDDNEAIKELGKHGIFINPKGEIEDLIPDIDIAEAAGVTEDDVKKTKASGKKTSDAFKQIFQTKSKVSYALIMADYYAKTDRNPLEKLIRIMYKRASKSS